MRAPSLLLHGPMEQLSSFSLVNRRLAHGLRERGWHVDTMATDASAVAAPAVELPDVYLFHGHPYDITAAPGRVNVFALSYDYARFVDDDRHLAVRLNTWFDALIVPSRFSRAACRRSGVTIPIHVCPYGVDAEEFHRDVRPVDVPGRRGFCFVTLGGATERKGTDVLLTAFAREFTDADDVTLLVKAFSYRHLAPWAAHQVAGARRRRSSPHIVWDDSEPASVASYFTAGDAGVFPFRGEGFGLPILECLASGTPAIVTRSGGPRDFGRVGVTWLKAAPTNRHRKAEVEPDVDDLRRLMRRAVRRGTPTASERRRIARAAGVYTWERAIVAVDRVLRRTAPRVSRAAAAPTVYCHFEDGRTSWRQISGHINRALTRRDRRHVSLPFSAPGPVPNARVVVAQSGHGLECFSRARRTTVARILHRESGPVEVMSGIIRRERAACGVAPSRVPPMALWRDRTELSLADVIVTTSTFSRSLFVDAGYAPGRLRVLAPGISRQPALPRRTAGPTRFLFVASDPFRKGVRVLLDAWSRVRGRAELWCVMASEALTSPLVLGHLTRDPRIIVRPFLVGRAWPSWFDAFDVLVLPSFEEGFPATIGEGMARGMPAILSTASGITDIVIPGENGVVTPADDAGSLANAIQLLAGDRAAVQRLGRAARDTAREYTWARYQRGWCDLIDEVSSR